MVDLRNRDVACMRVCMWEDSECVMHERKPDDNPTALSFFIYSFHHRDDVSLRWRRPLDFMLHCFRIRDIHKAAFNEG
jgi:hypothetical protein